MNVFIALRLQSNMMYVLMPVWSVGIISQDKDSSKSHDYVFLI